ncbi:MAG: tRNA (guanosine(46)-N7)-methyltransferase TrmB [Verrucomicrobia bacterium]|nr:MAG: tRNA (guanosine(46)-N7)-methyltransferase TrmB [Verrucomicrobiota bacterium]
MNLAYEHILEEAAERKQCLKELCIAQFLGKTVTLEIGCGHGHFLTSYAKSYPDRIFIGIDLSTDRIGRGKKKQETARLSNLHFIKAEANEFIESLPEGIVLEEIFILFPDPWPKTKHHKNRLMQESFLELLAQKVLPETKLYFRTDYDPYFEWTKEILEGSKFWELDDGLWPFEEESVFQKRMVSYQSLVAKRKAF